jgi:hypothetical protein
MLVSLCFYLVGFVPLALGCAVGQVEINNLCVTNDITPLSTTVKLTGGYNLIICFK